MPWGTIRRAAVSRLERFGYGGWRGNEAVIEATGNTASILRTFWDDLCIGFGDRQPNPPRVRAITHAKIMTDKIDEAVTQAPFAKDPSGKTSDLD